MATAMATATASTAHRIKRLRTPAFLGYGLPTALLGPSV